MENTPIKSRREIQNAKKEARVEGNFFQILNWRKRLVVGFLIHKKLKLDKLDTFKLKAYISK